MPNYHTRTPILLLLSTKARSRSKRPNLLLAAVLLVVCLQLAHLSMFLLGHGLFKGKAKAELLGGTLGLAKADRLGLWDKELLGDAEGNAVSVRASKALFGPARVLVLASSQ